MDLLIDTHVLIWWDARIPRLGSQARSLISDRANRILVSAASVWEIAIKRRQGRLTFSGSIAETVRANGFEALPCDLDDAEFAGELAWAHTDPFDRMIVAQAQRRTLPLITADRAMMAWPSVAMIPAEA